MYLGIDWGKKEIGLATANKKERVATPLKTIENNKATTEEIKKICEEEKIDKIILGMPESFDGKRHETANRIKKFGEKLKAHLELPIEFENEIFSSKIAKKFSRKDVDQRAATIILQSYLNKEEK
jgi:putative Holliday junction resolvase